MIDGGVPITEDEDLTFLSKHTFWRVGHDLFHFANKVTGMDWNQVWSAFPGDTMKVQAISVTENIKPIDFVELFNPGNFRGPPNTHLSHKRPSSSGGIKESRSDRFWR